MLDLPVQAISREIMLKYRILSVTYHLDKWNRNLNLTAEEGSKILERVSTAKYFVLSALNEK